MAISDPTSPLKEELPSSPLVLSLGIKVVDALTRWGGVIILLVGTSYALATTAQTLAIKGILTIIPPSSPSNSPSKPPALVSRSPQSSFNHFNAQRSVIQRNLFNADGEVPHDRAKSVSPSEITDGSCTPSTLPLRLSGTLVHQDPLMSVATLVDTHNRLTDSYRAGDQIIDFPATLTAIESGRVVLNHNGRRECLEVTASKTSSVRSRSAQKISSRRSEPSQEQPPLLRGEEGDPESGGSDGAVVLNASYVEDQLGEGFAKIIQATRLVPKVDPEGNPEGFRVFGIKPGTLLTRIGLKNGDILHQVNDANLKQPEEGFALYQALQDENEITIHLNRGGKGRTIKVRVE